MPQHDGCLRRKEILGPECHGTLSEESAPGYPQLSQTLGETLEWVAAEGHWALEQLRMAVLKAFSYRQVGSEVEVYLA